MSGERSYTTIDKTGWGDGPWNEEPDKIQWIDEATGLDCLIVRNRLGALCGYVGVPPEHPWHGIGYSTPLSGDADDYEHRPDYLTDVHGGLTYADRCQEDAPAESGICHVPLPGRHPDAWWFGFDCAHSCDVVPGIEAREREMGFGPRVRMPYEAYRTVAYVKAECAKLAAQLTTMR